MSLGIGYVSCSLFARKKKRCCETSVCLDVAKFRNQARTKKKIRKLSKQTLGSRHTEIVRTIFKLFFFLKFANSLLCIVSYAIATARNSVALGMGAREQQTSKHFKSIVDVFFVYKYGNLVLSFLVLSYVGTASCTTVAAREQQEDRL